MAPPLPPLPFEKLQLGLILNKLTEIYSTAGLVYIYEHLVLLTPLVCMKIYAILFRFQCQSCRSTVERILCLITLADELMYIICINCNEMPGQLFCLRLYIHTYFWIFWDSSGREICKFWQGGIYIHYTHTYIYIYTYVSTSNSHIFPRILAKKMCFLPRLQLLQNYDRSCCFPTMINDFREF